MGPELGAWSPRHEESHRPGLAAGLHRVTQGHLLHFSYCLIFFLCEMELVDTLRGGEAEGETGAAWPGLLSFT